MLPLAIKLTLQVDIIHSSGSPQHALAYVYKSGEVSLRAISSEKLCCCYRFIDFGTVLTFDLLIGWKNINRRKEKEMTTHWESRGKA